MHYVVGFLFSLLAFQTVFNAMWFILTIVGLKRLFKRMWVVGIAATIVFTFLAARGLFVDAPGLLWVNIAIAFIVVGITRCWRSTSGCSPRCWRSVRRSH